MAQIVRHPNAMADFGSALGTGLSEGLRELAEGKLRQLSKSRKEEARESFLKSTEGISPTFASALSKLSDEEYSLVLPEIMKEKREKEFAKNFLGGQQPGIIGQEPYSNNISQQAEIENIPQGENVDQIIKNITAQEQQAPEKELGGIASTVKKMIKEGYPVPKNSKEASELIKIAHTTNLEEKKMNAKEKREAFKDTKEIRREAYAEEKMADDRLEDLGRLEELEDEGLDTPGYIQGLKNAGIDIPALLSDPTQEASKIIQSFSRDIGKSFKGSISQFELEQFLATIPNLVQTPEGRKRVVSGLKKMYRLKSEYGKSVRKVIKENGGIPPLDLEEQVDERLEPIRERIKKQWRKDLEKKVPEAQNRAITAAQSAAGGLVGKLAEKLPSAIAHGAAGAAAGSAFPGLGNLAGGGLGALYGLFK